MTRRDGRSATSERTCHTTTPTFATSSGVRARMQRQRARDTLPELAVRRLLHSYGLRYRVDSAPTPALRGRADIIFGPTKVAVYVDGCFWHACPMHSHPVRGANAHYWETKLSRNRARDDETNRKLADAGWLVVRAWEHEPPDEVARRVAEAVLSRRELILRRRFSRRPQREITDRS